MLTIEPWIAVTDQAWFDFLSSRSSGGPLDEVNFWSPSSTKPMKALRPGEPVFFRLKAPANAIGGYGFFAHFSVLGLREAWTTFVEKNGDPDLLCFLERIGGYRHLDLTDPVSVQDPLGCTILRDAVFWERKRWISWGEAKGWAWNIVRGKTEGDLARASRLLAEIQYDNMKEPEDFAQSFEPLEVDERELLLAQSPARIGQGAFRSRLLDAHGRRCAITGERTEPVLDAAHVQPYLGPRSNHVQNGLLLAKEFHTLFDLGYGPRDGSDWGAALAQSDDHGRYRFPHVPRGTWWIGAAPSGLMRPSPANDHAAPFLRIVTIPEGALTFEHDLTVTLDLFIRGTVVDSDGTPVDGCWLEFRHGLRIRPTTRAASPWARSRRVSTSSRRRLASSSMAPCAPGPGTRVSSCGSRRRSLGDGSARASHFTRASFVIRPAESQSVT